MTDIGKGERRRRGLPPHQPDERNFNWYVFGLASNLADLFHHAFEPSALLIDFQRFSGLIDLKHFAVRDPPSVQSVTGWTDCVQENVDSLPGHVVEGLVNRLEEGVMNSISHAKLKSHSS